MPAAAGKKASSSSPEARAKSPNLSVARAPSAAAASDSKSATTTAARAPSSAESRENKKKKKEDEQVAQPINSSSSSRISDASDAVKQKVNNLVHAPIVDLTCALLYRLLTKKRFYALLIVIAAWLLVRSERVRDEVADFAATTATMAEQISGMQVEEPGRPGAVFASKYEAKLRRPVIFIPGFITTKLELWKSKPCMKSQFGVTFRQPLFGSHCLMKLMRDPDCYLAHLTLHPDNASDPEPDVIVRADTGYDSVDYIMQAYWVAAKLQINLADVRFTPPHLQWVASYDWRLTVKQMQERDAFVSRFRSRVERMVEHSGQRAVLVCHSYGSIITADLLTAVEKTHPGWTDKFVSSIVSIGGAALGVTKAVSALISGEVRDTQMMPGPTRRLMNNYIRRRERAKMLRTFPCLERMLPRGPSALWGTDGSVVSLSTQSLLDNGTSVTKDTNLTYGASLKLLRDIAAQSKSMRLVQDLDSEAAASSSSSSSSSAQKSYERPLTAAPFPVAKKTTMYCLYGVGKLTEVGYRYVVEEGGTPEDLESLELAGSADGVVLGDGDGTVTLASLGYLCRTKSAVGYQQTFGKVVTVEIPDKPKPLYVDPRGGSETSDHVDILGNYRVLESVLRIATGNEDGINDEIVSMIDNIVERVDSKL